MIHIQLRNYLSFSDLRNYISRASQIDSESPVYIIGYGELLCVYVQPFYMQDNSKLSNVFSLRTFEIVNKLSINIVIPASQFLDYIMKSKNLENKMNLYQYHWLAKNSLIFKIPRFNWSFINRLPSEECQKLSINGLSIISKSISVDDNKKHIDRITRETWEKNVKISHHSLMHGITFLLTHMGFLDKKSYVLVYRKTQYIRYSTQFGDIIFFDL